MMSTEQVLESSIFNLESNKLSSDILVCVGISFEVAISS